MDFDFEVLHQSGAHHQAAGAMSCLQRASLEEGEESEADIDDDILAYFSLGQNPEVKNVAQ